MTAFRCAECDGPGPEDRRGLCRGCYRDPAVRARHLCRDRAIAGNGAGMSGPRRLPERPCPCTPGSEGRIVTLESRAAAGTELWHPEDAAFVGVPVPMVSLAPLGRKSRASKGRRKDR